MYGAAINKLDCEACDSEYIEINIKGDDVYIHIRERATDNFLASARVSLSDVENIIVNDIGRKRMAQ